MDKKEEFISRQEKAASSTELSKKIAVKVNHTIVIIEMRKIVFINRENRKTTIHLENDKIISTNEQLDVIENRLSENSFFRCHRSFIINLDKVAEIQPWSRNSYIVIFNNSKASKKAAYITKNRYKKLQEIFKLIPGT